MLGTRQVDRVSLACLPCRNRRVKCDGVQPQCSRCKRDRKECTYAPSRRGGLDKAALAKRRMRLQQEAEAAEQSFESQSNDQLQPQTISERALRLPNSLPITLHASNDRLIGLYFENFWPAYPIVLPYHAFQTRMLTNSKHGMCFLVTVLQYIGSIYASWAPSETYYESALRALHRIEISPFNVQALMLLAVAEHHCDLRKEARKNLDLAIDMALQLQMNEGGFAQACCEGDARLAESWRRTYYFLHFFDQEFTVVAKLLSFRLSDISITVDLPCDDEAYESGYIPPPATLQQFNNREFEDIEIIYSSIAYLHDLCTILTGVMKIVMKTASFSESLTTLIDTKVASWQALLPSSKKEALREDGTVDEVMWQAHISAAILFTVHRPYSVLTYCPEEFITESFMVLSPMVASNIARRAAHTARCLRGLEAYTKLMAIPSGLEKHSVLSFSIAAQMATAQISACKNLLDDHAFTIGRDRLRLSIGFLNTMGAFWPLAKKMAKEVKTIARSQLSSVPNGTRMSTAMEVEIMRDELMWPSNPAVQVDIYAGTVLPMDWATLSSGYNSVASSIGHDLDPYFDDVTTPWA